MNGASQPGLLAALALLALTACQAAPDATSQIIARQQALDPPQLWLAQVVGEGGRPKASVFICVDAKLREGFARTRAEVNGAPCRDATGPIEKAHEWALRCLVGGQPFAVSAATTGDLAQDFRLDFALTPLWSPRGPDDDSRTVRQTRRFRRVGPCPAGWRIGDQARPGHRPWRPS